MRATQRRLLLYGLGSVTAGALVWAGFFYTADADALTLLGGAEIRLQQASIIKASEKRDELDDTYTELLRQAEADLRKAERAYPGLGMVHYYRGYMAYLDGRFVDAAAEYASARNGRAMSPEQVDRTVINEALMLRYAGRNDEAANVLAAHQGEFTSALAERGARELESARSAASTVPAAPGGAAANRPGGAQGRPEADR